MGVGDLSAQVQYRLTQLAPGSWLPTASLNVQESLPVGRYDRLQRPSDGFGSGAYSTTLSSYFQSYFWLPNGRIVRARLDLSYAISSRASISDQSVYGTPLGFRGHADPGDSAYLDLAFEYSATRNWVAAIDIWSAWDASTRVVGAYPPSGGGSTPVAFGSTSSASRKLFLAPALEYNWSSRIGVILGVRIVAAGRNTTGLITPAVALSYFD